MFFICLFTYLFSYFFTVILATQRIIKSSRMYYEERQKLIKDAVFNTCMVLLKLSDCNASNLCLFFIFLTVKVIRDNLCKTLKKSPLSFLTK